MKQQVIVIMGATSVGKTKYAIELAKRLNGECLSCDSVAVYRGMDIGSAKPTVEELAQVKHYGVDLYDVSQKMSVADFQGYARCVIEKIVNKGKVPILVGGTGLYIKAILMDYVFHREPVDDMDNPYLAMSSEQLHQLLTELDGAQALKIHVNNRQRLERYFTLYHQSQMTRSDLLAKQKHEWLYDFKMVYLTLPREQLVQRIDARVERMFEAGLINEVESLSMNGELLSLPAFNAIGYREFSEYFNGEIGVEELKRAIKTHTRQFSKRQLTWFKHQMAGEVIDVSDAGWFDDWCEGVRAWINIRG